MLRRKQIPPLISRCSSQPTVLSHEQTLSHKQKNFGLVRPGYLHLLSLQPFHVPIIPITPGVMKNKTMRYAVFLQCAVQTTISPPNNLEDGQYCQSSLLQTLLESVL